jgi:hypothetical protein
VAREFQFEFGYLNLAVSFNREVPSERHHLIKEPGSGQGNNGVINLNLAVLFPGAERQFRGFKAKVAANDPVAGYKPASRPQGENEV